MHQTLQQDLPSIGLVGRLCLEKALRWPSRSDFACGYSKSHLRAHSIISSAGPALLCCCTCAGVSR